MLLSSTVLKRVGSRCLFLSFSPFTLYLFSLPFPFSQFSTTFFLCISYFDKLIKNLKTNKSALEAAILRKQKHVMKHVMYEMDMMFIYKRKIPQFRIYDYIVQCPNIHWIDSLPSSHFQPLAGQRLFPYYLNVACVDSEGLILLTFNLLLFCPFCMLTVTTNLIKQKLCCIRYIKLQPQPF